MRFHYVREPGDDGGILVQQGDPPGTDLSSLLDETPPPLRAALEIVGALADILSIAEEDRAVHGAVQPGEVRITPEGAVVLTGFGVERRTSRAPEGRPDGPAVDVYGLGTVVHALLARAPLGRLPAEPGAHDAAVAERFAALDLQGLGDAPWLDQFRTFLATFLAHDPEGRPSPVDAAEVLADVASQAEGADLPTWAGGAVRQRRRATRREEALPAAEATSAGIVPGNTTAFRRLREPATTSRPRTMMWTRDSAPFGEGPAARREERAPRPPPGLAREPRAPERAPVRTDSPPPPAHPPPDEPRPRKSVPPPRAEAPPPATPPPREPGRVPPPPPPPADRPPTPPPPPTAPPRHAPAGGFVGPVAPPARANRKLLWIGVAVGGLALLALVALALALRRPAPEIAVPPPALPPPPPPPAEDTGTLAEQPEPKPTTPAEASAPAPAAARAPEEVAAARASPERDQGARSPAPRPPAASRSPEPVTAEELRFLDYQVRIELEGAERGVLECPDQQPERAEVVGHLTRSLRATTANPNALCRIRVGRLLGAVIVQRSGTITCRVDERRITCGYR